jgi:hypothetical protein
MWFPTEQLRRFPKADEGQALVLASLALAALMLMAGLGIDVAYLRYQKQQMQKAADAGAIAGASALIYSGNVTAAGRNDSAANGFQNGANGTTVTVNHPPQTAGDPLRGNSDYVEVIVSQPQPTFFMRVGGFTSVPVAARAVASAVAAGSGCIFVMDPADSGTYTAAGGVALTSVCGIYIDSRDSKALVESGGSCTSADYIGIVGSDVGSQGACFPKAQPVSGIAPFNDPLAGVQPPTAPLCPANPPAWSPAGSCNYQPNPGLHCTGSATLQAGTYCGGITASSSSVVLTFSPGTYVLAGGGMNITGGSGIRGTGVTFYNTVNASDKPAYNAISITGGSTISLSAPTSGPLDGILFFQDRNLPAKYQYKIKDTISGNSSTNLNGALYFPLTQELDYTGGSLATDYTIIVTYKLVITGNSTINDNYTSLDKPPVRSAALAE